MNKVKKLSLTLLSSLVLVACGGGSKGTHHQTSTKTEVKTETKKSETLQPQAGNNRSIKTQPTEVYKKSEAEQAKSEKKLTEDKQAKHLLSNPDKTAEPVSQKLSDSEIFGRFSKNGGHYDANAWMSINLDGTELKLAGLSDAHLNAQQIHTLRDSDGQLVGYYGYAALSKTKPSQYHPEENVAEYKYMALREAREEARSVPNVDMTYRGKMYYALDSAPQQALEADVSANYRNASKSISIEIAGQSDRSGWHLTTNTPQSVSENGSIFTQLYTRENGKLVKAGQFDGGLYGKNGEILLGEAKHEDSTKQENNWKGAVGATATK